MFVNITCFIYQGTYFSVHLNHGRLSIYEALMHTQGIVNGFFRVEGDFNLLTCFNIIPQLHCGIKLYLVV